MTQATEPTNLPQVPALFELERAAPDIDITQACIERATQGADEGLVLLAQPSHTVVVRGGQWQPGEHNVVLSLLLQPDYSRSRCEELVYVANVSLVRAIAALASPMTPVQFGWPNHLVMAGLRAGAVWVDIADNESQSDNDPAWAVVTIAINLSSYPETIDHAISIQALEGQLEFTRDELVDQVLRQFLSWINVWAEDGLGELIRTISPRLIQDHDTLSMLAGKFNRPQPATDNPLVFDGLDARGGLNMTQGAHTMATLSLSDWFARVKRS